MKLNAKNIESLLVYMAFGLLFIDALTGMLMFKLNLNTNLSILYKIVFLFGCLTLLYTRSKFKYHLSIGLLFFLVTLTFVRNITTDISYLIGDFGDGLKLLSTIIVFFAFSNFKYYDVRKFLKYFLVITLSVLAINILFSLVGIGRSTYGNFGAKGFFQSGNSLSAIIVLLSSFIMVRFYRKGILYFIIAFLFMVSCGAAVGTKSSILGVVLIAGMIPLYRFKLTPKQLCIVGLSMPILIMSIYGLVQILMDSMLFERISFFYQNGGITRVLLSGRDNFFMAIYPKFSESGFIHLLFGLGADGLASFDKARIEIDPIDMVFTFGLLVTTIYYFLLSTVLKSVCFHRLLLSDDYHYDLKLSASLSAIVLLFMSFVAGHVLINGVVTFIWGGLLATPLWYKNRYRLVNHECNN